MPPEKQNDFHDLVEQARSAFERLSTIRAELDTLELTGRSGDGLVAVTLRGDGEAVEVRIDRAAVDLKDLTRLEDLLVAAINEARRGLREFVEKNSQF